MSLFVTGTDTGVGKTVVATALALKLGYDYWKPVQCGTPTDSEFAARWVDCARVRPEAYCLAAPLAPPVAARMQKVNLQMAEILAMRPSRPTIVEGAGGVLTPLTERTLFVDLIEGLDYPTILVARSTLGTINHSLLALEALRGRNVPVLGVIMVGPPDRENTEAIEKYGKVKVLAALPIVPEFTRAEFLRLGQMISLEGELCHKSIEC